MKPQFFSALYALLIRNSEHASTSIWKQVWDWSSTHYKGIVSYYLHGEHVRLNNGNMYPFFKTKFPTLNNPIVELVYQTYKAKQKTINYVDIGAAIGDTMLLIFQECPNMINFYYCIDGDEEFFSLLKYNLRNHSNGKLIKVLLTDYENDTESSLVRTHSGTASSQGINSQKAFTLDEILMNEHRVENVDLIKIDVDGLDGKVICGAEKTIKKFNPSIIFEWHPILYNKTGNSVNTPFIKLKELGYTRFVFFDKYGKFTHFNYTINEEEIFFYKELCLRERYDTDWHYDVVALHNTSEIKELEMAEMAYTHHHFNT